MERKYEHKFHTPSAGFGPFICANCGNPVATTHTGSRHRNHCPSCLHSLHVDLLPGDRRSRCRGIMHPIALWVKEDGEMAIVHRCGKCGVVKPNRVLSDDNEEVITRLALKPAQAIQTSC